MPCWNVIKITYSETELNLPDFELAIKALTALGFTVAQNGKALAFKGIFDGQVINASIYDGKLVYQDNFITNATIKALTNAIRRGYSQTVVSAAAIRFGWTQRATGNNRMTITRR